MVIPLTQFVIFPPVLKETVVCAHQFIMFNIFTDINQMLTLRYPVAS